MARRIPGYRRCDHEPEDVLKYWGGLKNPVLLPFDFIATNESVGPQRDRGGSVSATVATSFIESSEPDMKAGSQGDRVLGEQSEVISDGTYMSSKPDLNLLNSPPAESKNEERSEEEARSDNLCVMVPLDAREDSVRLGRPKKMVATRAPQRYATTEKQSPIATVEETKLDTLPYQSIGIIIASTTQELKVGARGTEQPTIHRYATAFYIGQDCTVDKQQPKKVFKVLTVAHFIEDKRYTKDYFAFLPYSNVNLSNAYDVYPVLSYLVHPQYEEHKAKYDICVMYVVPKQSAAGDRHEVIKPPWEPLKLVVTHYSPSSEYIWKVIGYPADANSKTLREFEGKYIPAYEIDDYEPNTVELRNMHLVDNSSISLNQIQGMSGGPWILTGAQCSDEVNGIQARFRSDTTKDCVSPYFRAKVLDELNLGYIKKPAEHII